jgi:formate hydrogenlyase transcriptional activator
MERPLLLQTGILSTVSAPLLTAGRAIGVLHVGSREANRYTAEDAEFLQALARQIALAIENILAYEEIARLKAKLEEENVYLQEEARGGGLEGIIGVSRMIRRVKQAVATVAGTDATVLITGETGTGKELVARAIHEGSPRRGRTLVKVNCAALPASLIESELFGHEKGAFTGALARKLGRFELADKGTIFLDEVGDLPFELQAKLLRVLQEGEFERVGGIQTL